MCTRLKFADFAGAWDSSRVEASEVFGTKPWKCPDMQAGTAADAWGCGCVLSAMLDGTMPFSEFMDRHDGCIEFEDWAWWECPMPEAFPTEAKDLVRRILQKKDARISVADIQGHRWLLQLPDELGADTLSENEE